MDGLTVGKINLTWLKGGVFHLDGGAMFGVVPKTLWHNKYPANEKNQITQCCDPILIEAPGKRILLETGLGKEKLSAKQKQNFGVVEESRVEECLQEKGLTREDIDCVVMTHLHFDHAGGLTGWQEGELVPVFPCAKIIVSQTEWQEMRNPNLRSRNTYWKENWEPVQGLVEVFAEEKEVVPGIKVYHTGGHSAGHSLVMIESEGEVVLHLGDLLPTNAHRNPLWVMAYDDYPLASIAAKEKWLEMIGKEDSWTTFYHDVYIRALRINREGKAVETMEAKDRVSFRNQD